MEAEKRNNSRAHLIGSGVLCALLCLVLTMGVSGKAWAADVGPVDILDINKRSIAGRSVDVNLLRQGIYIDFHNSMGTNLSVHSITIDGVAKVSDSITAYGEGFFVAFISGSKLNFSSDGTHSIYASLTLDGITYENTFTVSVTGNSETGTGNNGGGSTDIDGGSSGGGGGGEVIGGATNPAEGDLDSPTSSGGASSNTPSEKTDGALSNEGNPANTPSPSVSESNPVSSADEADADAVSLSDLAQGGLGNADATLLAATGAFSKYAGTPSVLSGAQLTELGSVFSLSGAKKNNAEDKDREQSQNAIDLDIFGYPIIWLLLCALFIGAAPAGIAMRSGVFASRGIVKSRIAS